MTDAAEDCTADEAETSRAHDDERAVLLGGDLAQRLAGLRAEDRGYLPGYLQRQRVENTNRI